MSISDQDLYECFASEVHEDHLGSCEINDALSLLIDEV